MLTAELKLLCRTRTTTPAAVAVAKARCVFISPQLLVEKLAPGYGRSPHCLDLLLYSSLASETSGIPA